MTAKTAKPRNNVTNELQRNAAVFDAALREALDPPKLTTSAPKFDTIYERKEPRS